MLGEFTLKHDVAYTSEQKQITIQKQTHTRTEGNYLLTKKYTWLMFALQSNSYPFPFNSSLFHSQTNFRGITDNVRAMYTDEHVSTSSRSDTVFILQLRSV